MAGQKAAPKAAKVSSRSKIDSEERLDRLTVEASVKSWEEMMETLVSKDDQVKVSRFQSTIAHLSAIRDQLSSMLELAAQEGGTPNADAAFQLFKQDIIQRINGGGASFLGISLFVGESSEINLSISGGVEDPLFASWVWGADNDRIREDVSQFRPLTADERSARIANQLSDSEPCPQTHAEKKARRLRNIFDEEYGHIRKPERAGTMMVQLENAIKQIITLITRFDTKATNIISQRKERVERPDVEGTLEVLSSSKQNDLMECAVAKLIEMRDRQQVLVGREI